MGFNFKLYAGRLRVVKLYARDEHEVLICASFVGTKCKFTHTRHKLKNVRKFTLRPAGVKSHFTLAQVVLVYILYNQAVNSTTMLLICR